ncbi:MAG: menaquinone biosynthesis protein [Bacteroidales bacterium]|nr:menaquinone biosynthesis protein [Bacteroidales bacterium]
MDFLKISAVCYLNTFPFVYGLKESGLLKNFRLELDVPAICAEKLKAHSVDISLVPVGALTDFGHFHFISGYCIGAVRPVKTVLLLSKAPLEKITKIYLDPDSRTSVKLVRILAKEYWDINPGWVDLQPGQVSAHTSLESVVAIGDKTFGLRSQFPYIYDLAEEWIRFTGLPFVFAVWISRDKLPSDVIRPFEDALAFGVDHKRECLDYFRDKLPPCDNCLDYLENNISFFMDERKKQGLEKFLTYASGQ